MSTAAQPPWLSSPLVVVLDTTPLGLLSQRPGVPDADDCRRWLAGLLRRGAQAVVPEIADYELRRELLRAGKARGVIRLDEFNAAEPDRYIPLNTISVRRAAALWAEVRRKGVPTADVEALDGDVLLAAQALCLGVEPAKLVVATSNPRHLSRLLRADLWPSITL